MGRYGVWRAQILSSRRLPLRTSVKGATLERTGLGLEDALAGLEVEHCCVLCRIRLSQASSVEVEISVMSLVAGAPVRLWVEMQGLSSQSHPATRKPLTTVLGFPSVPPSCTLSLATDPECGSE